MRNFLLITFSFLFCANLFSYQLFVKIINNKTITVEVNHATVTIYDIKKAIEFSRTIPIERQRLVVNQKLPDDTEQVREVAPHGSTVNLIVKLTEREILETEARTPVAKAAVKNVDERIKDFKNNLRDFNPSSLDADFLAIQLISSLDGIISYKLPISSIVKTAADLNILTDLEIADPDALLSYAESWLTLYAGRGSSQLIKLFSLNKDLFLKRLAAYNIVLARIVADQNIFFVRDKFFGVQYFGKVGDIINLYETKVRQPSFQTFQEKFRAIHIGK